MRFDAIVSNPPYLSENDPHLRDSLLFEPISALVAGKTGLEAFMKIAHQAPARLREQGWILFEHGCDQAQEVQKILADQGFSGIDTYHDLQGLHVSLTAASRDILNTYNFKILCYSRLPKRMGPRRGAFLWQPKVKKPTPKSSNKLAKRTSARKTAPAKARSLSKAKPAAKPAGKPKPKTSAKAAPKN